MTQTEKIRRHLESGRPITPLEALHEYGCFRLGARIWDLKRSGYPIETRTVTDERTGKTYAEYSRAEAVEGEQMLLVK